MCVCVCFQAISCHYSSADCFYIDVKGTTQENIEKEVADVITKKYTNDMKINFQVRSSLLSLSLNKPSKWPI